MSFARQSLKMWSARRELAVSRMALPAIAAALDVCLLSFASAFGAIGYGHYAAGRLAAPEGFAGIWAISAALFCLLAQIGGLYALSSLFAPAANLARAVAILTVALLGVVCVLFLLKIGSEYSRGAMVAYAAIALCAIPLGRLSLGLAVRAGVRRGIVRGKRVVTLGDAAEFERLREIDLAGGGVDEVARVILQGSVGDAAEGLDTRDRERVAKAIAIARELQAAEFAVIMPWSRDGELADLCRLLRASPLSVRLYADQRIRGILSHARARDFRRLSIEVQREPLNWRERALKRAMDVVLASAALVVLTPLLAVVALAIRLDSPGPAIFRQRRCGFDSREFVMFKFRTMTVLEDGDTIVQTKRGDKRVTRLGRLLRRASIDEL
ncbi:MAG: sugar transferase, partial [Hyphomicrobiales bacterium]|nr:sugar transferase [Hyphomicrobiales bacterium]